jgi:phage/colicin/tellurite resistance cluster terY protein
MVFDPTKYQSSGTPERYMPVVLLLDVSGSMSGDKIDNLYDATVKMIETFVEEGKKEIPFKLAIITFGARVECHTRYTDVKDLQNLTRFQASGMTPLGAALRMAKDMIEDRDETKGRWYRPAVVLVSDGQPNDDFRQPMKDFMQNGRSAKCQRIAMAIGNDADEQMLKSFVSDSAFYFKAENAADIIAKFNLVTMSVASRAASKNADDFPGAVSTASRSVSRRTSVKTESDEDEYL